MIHDPPTDSPTDDPPGPPVDEGRRPIFALASTGADLLQDIAALIRMARDERGPNGFVAYAQRLVAVAADHREVCDKLHRLDEHGECPICNP